MLTGKRAFDGTSAASLIGNIMNSQPPALATLQPLTPPALDRLVRDCLAKSPDDRPDAAHDAARELRWVRESSGVSALTGSPPRRRRALRVALLVAVGVVVGLMAGAGTMWLLRPSPPRPSMARVSVDVRPAEEVNAGGVRPAVISTPGGSRTAFAWTPDGQALVFVGRRGGVQQLYVRRLDAAEAWPLARTEDAQVPAVSPDGQWVAFWAGGVLKKVRLAGGPVMDLASGVASPPRGLVWGSAGSLFCGRDLRIWTMPPEGAPAAVTTPGESEVSHGLPWPLPGERVLLYTVRKRWWSWGDEAIVAQTLATGVRKTVLTDAADARYVPTGHLVFLRRGVLYAVGFDAERQQVVGKEVPVLDTVAQALTGGIDGDVTGAGQYAVSPLGTLAWVPSSVLPYPDKTLVTLDRHGQVEPLSLPAKSYGSPVRLSPDGRRLAAVVMSLTGVEVWVYDLSRGTPTVLGRGGEAFWPVWTPDGSRLVFRWLADGRPSLAVQLADGTGPPQRLIVDGTPSSFTPGGRQLAVARASGDLRIGIVTLEPGPARVQPLTDTPNTEYWPEVSPDGRWLAYGSNVSRRGEVYVRPYPGPGAAQEVSLDGGDSPAWHQNGHELFFVTLPDPAGKRRMMAVAFTPGNPPTIGRPTELFSFDPRELAIACTPVRCYDVAPNGLRFYGVQHAAPPAPPVVTHINLITNWFEELKAKVPAKR
jgi:eukaryotic-like serine/threonine-protein kinase